MNVVSKFALILLVGVSEISGALVWTEKVIETSADRIDGEVFAVFEFENKGTKPVEILEIRTGCECTAAFPTKTMYQPGESGELEVIFEIEGRMGRQERMIQVKTDAPHRPVSQLMLRVDLPEMLVIEPHHLRWAVGGPTETKSVLLTPTVGNEIRSVRLPTGAQSEGFDINIIPKKGGFILDFAPSDTGKIFTFLPKFEATFEDGTIGQFNIYLAAR